MREGSITRRDRAAHVLNYEFENGRRLDVATGPVDQHVDDLVGEVVEEA
jgi:hypothetical protein